MSKHTPGPWTAHGTVVRAEGRFICKVKRYPTPGYPDTGELAEESEQIKKANARLIAAAPDLLEALKRIMDGFDAGVWCRSIKDDNDPMWAIKIIGRVQALGAAVAAIQKAERDEAASEL